MWNLLNKHNARKRSRSIRIIDANVGKGQCHASEF